MREFFAAHSEAERRGMPVDEVLAEIERRRGAARRAQALEREREADRMTRRAFVQRAALAGVGLSAARAWRPDLGSAATSPRIVVVGAGLAGLRAAHKLANRGKPIACTVYEADTTHLGGRCWSLRGYFDNGLVAEHGGAFINHDQQTIRNLASSLHLDLEVVNGGDLPKLDEIYWFDGKPYTYAEANDDWGAIGFPAFHAALKSAPFPQLYNSFTPAGKQLDNTSVPEWLDQVDIGTSSRFGRLMLANAVSEYGGDPDDQPALNLIYLTGFNPRSSLDPLAGYDEKFHIVGGNDQLITKMLEQLPPETIKQGHELVALKDNGDGTYTLTFQHDNKTVQIGADHVVLALPFSALGRVDLSKSGLSSLKRRAINRLGMGQSAKIHVQVERKTWPPLGYAGATYSDWFGFCVAWDDSVPLGPDGAPAILLGYPGGSTGQNVLTGVAHGPAPERDVRWFLDQIEPIFPGTTRAASSGLAWEDHWSRDPWHLGAYSFWRVGQYTAFAGYEGVQEGNIHFAGEHTEPEDQGFMDGAVVSGERVASEIARQV
jgi:monoamine oxidase